MKRIVVALGGNALLRRGERLEPTVQERNLGQAGAAIAPIAAEAELIVTHGSGPQVGILAMRAEEAPGRWKEPLDVIGAETDGMIGYVLARELGNALPDRTVATILTQVEVDPSDPALDEPSKPIGAVYPEAEAHRFAKERGWSIAREETGWRRVVASPEPTRIVELASAAVLVDAGHVVVCAGGGGVPVRRDAEGRLHGVEAVVDKDLSAALLARDIGADVLLLLTDAECIYRDWPERREPIRRTTPDEVRALTLPAGSMGPKAEAAARFVEATGGRAIIGKMEEVQELLEGSAGTHIVPADRAPAQGEGT